MNKRYILICLACFSLLISSCKKDSVIAPDPAYRSYFSDKVGSYIIYQCDSIIYDDFNQTVDTNSFLIKEYFESTFIDNSGRSAIRIERWKKPADTLSWFLKDVWQCVKTDAQVEKVEEDVRFIKMVFPVRESIEWNGNALNSLTAQTLTFSEVHKPFTTGTLDFDSTITVVNTDPENLVSELRTTEVFAANVGMVFKKYVDVKYVVPTSNIKSGVVFTMKAIEIGVQ